MPVSNRQDHPKNLGAKESTMSANTETAILALLLGRPGAAAPPRWSHLKAGRIHRRPERKPDVSQAPWARRSSRDRLRPRPPLLPRHPRVLLPDPRPDHERTARATTSALTTARRSSIRATSSARSPGT